MNWKWKWIWSKLQRRTSGPLETASSAFTLANGIQNPFSFPAGTSPAVPSFFTASTVASPRAPGLKSFDSLLKLDWRCLRTVACQPWYDFDTWSSTPITCRGTIHEYYNDSHRGAKFTGPHMSVSCIHAVCETEGFSKHKSHSRIVFYPIDASALL